MNGLRQIAVARTTNRAKARRVDVAHRRHNGADSGASPRPRLAEVALERVRHWPTLHHADGLLVARRWIQDAGTWSEHFDIAKSKKAAAIKHGARPVAARELVARMHLKQPEGERPSWVARVLQDSDRDGAHSSLWESCGYALYGPPALCTCGTCKETPGE